MTADVRTFIPIRSFNGMSRLRDALGPAERRALARSVAARTVRAALEAGTIVSVISNDAAVDGWAEGLGVASIAEPSPGSLNAAAAAGIATTSGDPWLVVHADLPAVRPEDIRTASSMAQRGVVLAPSHDGGTSLVGESRPEFPFRYGPGSFHRHLSAVGENAMILVRPGLALDLDRPRDLEAFRLLGYLDPSPTNFPDSTGEYRR